MTPINFPWLGNSLIMAIVILVHVFFAFVAVGGLVLAVASEWIGARRPSPFHDRFAEGMVAFLSDMMKLGGVLGVTIVVLLIGLFPEFAKELYHIFFWPFVLEAALFFTMLGATIWYRNAWRRAGPKGGHIAIGAVAAGAAVCSALVINAAHAFMLTPGRYFETKALLDAVLNPSMLVSSTHLLIPCIINAAAFALLYAEWKARRAEGEERRYVDWMRGYAGKIFAGAILLQPLSGLSFLFTVRSANEAVYGSIVGGSVARFFWPMVGLGVVAVGSSLIYWLSRCRARRVLVAGSLAALIAFSFGGYTRERARKPYLIYGHMTMSDAVAAPKGAEVKPSTPKAALAARGCLACHRFQGEGGTFGPALDAHLKHHSKEELKKFLRNPPPTMPPFAGTDGELDAFVDLIGK